MKQLIFLLSVALTLAIGCKPTKPAFFDSPEAYLRQSLPGEQPQIFAEGLLADTCIALDRAAFSADGKEFYYCTAPAWFKSEGAKVQWFRYENNKWVGPAVLNEKLYAPTFSIDDQFLYFQGGKGKVWRSNRGQTGWTAPELWLNDTITGFYCLMPTRSGAYYIGSNANQGNIADFKTYDFCRLVISKSDTMIEKLQGSINTPGFDGDFYVAPDESYMIVSANETENYESELHISFRNPDHTWTKPRSLGDQINNGLAHRWGQYVTPDGKFLFYTQGTSEKDCHIYWLRFDKLLERFRAEK